MGKRAVVVVLKEETYRSIKVSQAHTDLTGDQFIRMLIDLSGLQLGESVACDPRVLAWIKKNVGEVK
jgi:hypothetical protein